MAKGMFNLRIQPQQSPKKRKQNPKNSNNQAEARVNRKGINEKNKQLNDAVQWCLKNKTTGYQAIKTGKYPLIKSYKTINKRLHGDIITGEEKTYCSILYPDEEKSIVEFLKNKNRSYQGMNRKDLTKLILDVLKIRNHYNKTIPKGRRTRPLSKNAKAALETNKLSKSFWRRWDAKYRDVTLKRQGTISANRALNCTLEMAQTHLDGLAKELIDAGIFTNAEQIGPGAWEGEIDTSRIFNHDETPQFINYGVDGTPNGLVYGARGESCKKLLKENRECVTINPVISLDGKVCMCQVIFAGKGVTSNMAPKKAVDRIPYLLVSTTENGMQDHKSLHASYKVLDKYCKENQVTLPAVVLSDGHSSRYNYDVLKFLHDCILKLYVGPPDTTSVTQVLDQINRALHYHYSEARDKMFTPFASINREGFMQILADIWPNWVTPESIRKAAKRVGISAEGLNVNWMQKDKFIQAQSCMSESSSQSSSSGVPSSSSSSQPSVSSLSSSTSPAITIESPEKARRFSAPWYQFKLNKAQEIIDGLNKSSKIDLNEIPGLLSIKKVVPKDVASKNVRVTQVYGSVEGNKILEVVEKVKMKKDEKEKKRKLRCEEKLSQEAAFERCKSKCQCIEPSCSASGLKKCPNCNDVLKSVCGKAGCQVDGKKPEMILPAKPTIKRRRICDNLDQSDESDMEFYESDVSDIDDGDENEDLEDYSNEDETDDEMDEMDELEDEFNQAKKAVQRAWISLSLPNKEDDLLGKWYGLIYASKKQNMFFIGKVLSRFLEDKNGPVESIEFHCLKPKVGSGEILEDTPPHLSSYNDTIPIKDIIVGPLQVEPQRGTKYLVKDYEKLVKHFKLVSDLDRNLWK